MYDLLISMDGFILCDDTILFLRSKGVMSVKNNYRSEVVSEDYLTKVIIFNAHDTLK